jgi:holin-like protein
MRFILLIMSTYGGSKLKLLSQWGIILAICIAGNLLSSVVSLPIPGNVFGMLILFILLCTKVIKVEMLEETTKFLLDHLAFFFIPAGVGLIGCLGLLSEQWLVFSTICFLTTFIVLLTTGHAVQLVKKIENKFRKCDKQ